MDVGERGVGVGVGCKKGKGGDDYWDVVCDGEGS